METSGSHQRWCVGDTATAFRHPTHPKATCFPRWPAQSQCRDQLGQVIPEACEGGWGWGWAAGPASTPPSDSSTVPCLPESPAVPTPLPPGKGALDPKASAGLTLLRPAGKVLSPSNPALLCCTRPFASCLGPFSLRTSQPGLYLNYDIVSELLLLGASTTSLICVGWRVLVTVQWNDVTWSRAVTLMPRSWRPATK